MKSISIVVAAYRINENTVHNFIGWNKEVFETMNIKLIVVSDRDMEFEESWVRTLVYPHEQEKFSIPKTVNYGIRRATTDIIIKSDVDIYFSLDVLRNVEENLSIGNGMVCLCAEASQLKYAVNSCHDMWHTVKILWNGRGGCFAMMRDDWHRLCGYNEKIFGWGADDDEMWERASGTINMELSHEFMLWHIKHPYRKSGNQKDFFPVRTVSNRQTGWEEKWEDEKWGMPDE
jgi:predicted glycosyltransferase involved in capsule biosynthesis